MSTAVYYPPLDNLLGLYHLESLMSGPSSSGFPFIQRASQQLQSSSSNSNRGPPQYSYGSNLPSQLPFAGCHPPFASSSNYERTVDITPTAQDRMPIPPPADTPFCPTYDPALFGQSTSQDQSPSDDASSSTPIPQQSGPFAAFGFGEDEQMFRANLHGFVEVSLTVHPSTT
jgi:hypothetical protein